MKTRFFVVIHAQNSPFDYVGRNHVINETKKAFDNGATGVFLIPDYENESNGYSKRATEDDLFEYYIEVKNLFPDFLIGVNFLKRFESMQTYLIEKIKNRNFIMIQSDGSFAKVISFEEKAETEFFVGLAFKYSKSETASGEKLKRLCEDIPKFQNVIPTTSGAATGKSADCGKIREIRSYLNPNQRLGIASGTTEQNVDAFLDAGVTDFLVATSLIKENVSGFDILDEAKILKLSKKILT